jgi:hypothetical protein
MADYTLTAASVLASSQATLVAGTFGATVTAGQAVYQDTADPDILGRGKWKLADANGSGIARTVGGIALNGGASGQPASICTADPAFTHGLATVATTAPVIVLSGTAGALAPVADLTTGMMPNVVMIAISATQAVLKPVAGTVVL